MSKTEICFASLLFSLVVCFSGCSFKQEASSDEDTVQINEQESESIDSLPIEDLEEAWNVLLENSTKEFLGYHPIDESFLNYINGIYGDAVIKRIASYANTDNSDIWYKATGKSIHVLWYEYCEMTGVQSYDLETTFAFDCASDQECVIDFTGDLTLAEQVATTVYMDQQPNGILDCFSKNLLEEMISCDVLVTNNEFAYTERGKPLEGKAYTFRAKPARISLLDKIGVDVCGVANNHVYDFDSIGFSDTIDTLEKHGMPYMGAGENISDASRPVYLIMGGKKIALVAASQIERSLNYTKEATEVTGGVLKCLHPRLFCQNIEQAKRNADFVVVFVHWGTEGNVHYGTDQQALAKSFVEAGADVIIGGHTHCLQTVEYIEDVPVFYSLGNYYFSTTPNMPNAYDTGLAQLRIKKDGSFDVYFLPCQFNSGVTTLLSLKDNAKLRIINTLNDLSNTAEISLKGRITKKQNIN